jgi:transcriptional/translational regulatory protein YebC/TACO1
MFIETATDNPTRTVANVRSYLNKKGGQLMVSGSLDFMFERKSIFKISMTGVDIEELELDLIDSGMEEMEEDGEGNLLISASFTDFGNMQKALEDKKIEILNAELQRIPTTYVELNEEQEAEINLLLDLIESDDDVTNVFHNMKSI